MNRDRRQRKGAHSRHGGDTVAIVSTQRASMERTLQFVAYHLRLGVDHIFLFLDDPNDLAAERLRNQSKTTCIPCDSQHWREVAGDRPVMVQHRQVANANHFLQSQRGEFTWMIHLDSDELLCCPGGLQRTLECEGVNVQHLKMRPWEAVPESQDCRDAFREVHLFKVPRCRRYRLAWRLAARRGFFQGEYLRGYFTGKPAIRLDGSVRTMNIHRPKNDDGTDIASTVSKGISVLHYDAASFDEWQTKWATKIERFDQSRWSPNRRSQSEYFAELMRRGDMSKLREFYNQLYLLPHWDQFVLKRLGLLKRVDIPLEEFELPV